MLNLIEPDIVNFEDAYNDLKYRSQRESEYLKQMIRILQRKLYGASADKIEIKEFFNEVEAEVEAEVENTEEQEKNPETKVEGYTRKKAIRKPLPEYLPRKEIIYDLTPEEKICACCNQEMHKIGEESSEQLEFVPAHMDVLRHIR